MKPRYVALIRQCRNWELQKVDSLYHFFFAPVNTGNPHFLGNDGNERTMKARTTFTQLGYFLTKPQGDVIRRPHGAPLGLNPLDLKRTAASGPAETVFQRRLGFNGRAACNPANWSIQLQKRVRGVSG